MWGLDRLAAQAAPSTSPQQRPYSPAPRRPNHLSAQRPSLSQRSSTLSLVSASSANALPAGARAANGSSLKHQIAGQPPADVEDPLLVLERLTGPLQVEAEPETKPEPEPEPEAATNGGSQADDGQDEAASKHGSEDQIDFGGLGLQAFAIGKDSAGDEPAGSGTSEESFHVAQQSEQDRGKFEELHRSIKNCDELLQSVDKYLNKFRGDLSNVSAEIESLQARSSALGEKLEHRKTVEKLLAPVAEQVVLSPATVRKLADGSIDDDWVKALDDLKSKQHALESGKLDGSKIKAVEDLKPLTDDLATKAVERIRDYFASRIKALRSPNINAQTIQQNDFLRRKSLFAFLARRQPQLAEEIGRAYTNTMRWYYQTHFARYETSLRRLRLYVADKTDLLGEDPMSRSSSSTGSGNAKLPGHAPLNLGRRADTLRSLPQSALPASTAEESKVPTYMETPFLFFNLALLDNASWEYSFLTSFYPPNTALSNPHAVNRQFKNIFAPTLEIGQALTKSLALDSFDALGILLAVRLNQHFAFVLQRRKVPALEAYVNGTSMLLWPRFQVVMDAHCESLKRLTASLPSRPAGAAGAAAAFATLSGAASSSSSGGSANAPSTAPHPLTQRFANLLHGILALSSEAGDDEPVGHSLARLRRDYAAFVARLAARFGAGERGRRDKERCLGNNYALVQTVIAEVAGRLAGASRAEIAALQAQGAR